ncbi:hypothetical protein KR054_006144 [Drosophila jambulina]|nr:hypothetical protein KR054_006144 [Drosophila jambulina]
MSRQLDTPVASIYDMMLERHRKLASESESKNISMMAQRKIEEEPISNTKGCPKKQRSTKAIREMPSSLTLESESYRPPSTVTASHLTKKQTSMKVHPPAKREVINKLVEKIAMVCGKAKAEEVVPQPSQISPKQLSGRQRKGMTIPGTARYKQKLNKTNQDRRPLSPRKADRGPKDKKVDRVPREKTMLKSTPKLPKTSKGLQRSVRESVRSFKTAPHSNDRWRI